MAAVAEARTTYVLSLPAVRWAIGELELRQTHPFFVAYLYLRRLEAKALAAGDDPSDLEPSWSELGQYLSVQGHPPGLPYYRPMWHNKVSDRTRYWLNSNLAGSYAPSSLRSNTRRVVVVNEESHFGLQPDHIEQARTVLLNDTPMSPVVLAAFLFRDYGFTTTDDQPPEPSELALVLSEEFGLGDVDFERLFSESIPTSAASLEAWFVDADGDSAGQD